MEPNSLSLIIFSSFLCVHAIIETPPLITKEPVISEILFQVAKLPNDVDKPFFIECEADAEPPAKYRWLKNGKPFEYQAYDDRISQQPGRGTLIISSPRDEDEGQYQCFAENALGVATSNSVFLRKAELNSFKRQAPTYMAVNEGDPVKMVCHPPDGWPKPSVYWFTKNADNSIVSINSSRMTVDPEGNLWFSSVMREDSSIDFRYVCAATSPYRNEYKLGDVVSLKVVWAGSGSSPIRHEPVEQYVSRKNMVGVIGNRLELFCIFGGTPLPQIVWSKDGRPIQLNQRVTQGHYGKSLIIKHVSSGDGGTYVCEASNGVGNAKSHSMTLSLLSRPHFTVEPEVAIAAEGETVEFRCEATGIPEPQIKWIHNGLPLALASPNPRRKVTQNSIVIEKLEKLDIGNYGCNASNSLGYVYRDVYVNVLKLPPEIKSPPTDMATVDGATIEMTCQVFGAPKPEVKWIRNSMELTGGRYTTKPNGNLEIKEVNFLDAGRYTCSVHNTLGDVEASGSLEVKEHTKITDPPEDYETAAGSTATFRCNAVADSTLKLTISWLKDGKVIDFESQPRFFKSADNSLTISKTIELDSGTYTCHAKTRLDFVKAHATLIVQDVPNAPHLIRVQCNRMDASVRWEPLGDNRAPILSYTIQYNTSFTPDVWEVAYDNVPATDLTYSVAMSPWANYTFRVLARNKIGISLPSGHSGVCQTQPDVPYKNPDNVEGKGTQSNNLAISWTPMPEIEHNDEGFHYVVYWKRNIPGAKWNSEDVMDWRRSKLFVKDQPTFQEYRIKVVAVNRKGEANVAAKEVVGYSGEDVPLLAPQNLTLLQITTSTDAVLGWLPVPPESVRGHFKGYKIQTWSDADGEEAVRETHVKSDATRTLVTKFVPHTKNYARVLVYNGRFNGPPSETLSFVTPEGVPGTVTAFEAFPMGSSALFLVWKKPEKPNGVLIGYRISYQTVKGTKVGPLMEREPYIIDPTLTRAKLAGLEPNTKYRIHIRGVTRAGEGEGYFIEQRTRGSHASPPDVPQFTWQRVPSENGFAAVKITWLPNTEGKLGSHFFVKYKLRGEPVYLESNSELQEDNIIVRGLLPGEVYEFKVVAVDGEFLTESDVQEIGTFTVDSEIVQPKENVAGAGWFIGMMLAIVILLLILLIVCVIKRNRGGKYGVRKREYAYGRHNYPEDEPGFHEYSQPSDRHSRDGRASLNSDPKQAADSDIDSMADYADADAEGMNEDGSFIGQYGKNKKAPGETSSGGFTTLV